MDQVTIRRPLHFRVKVAREESPEEGQTANGPRPLRHAVEAAHEGEQRVTANRIGAPSPDDAAPQGTQSGALQAVVHHDNGWIAAGHPAMPPGVGLVEDVPAVNRLESADLLETGATIELGLTGDVVGGIAFGNELGPDLEGGGTAGHADASVVEVSENGSEAVRPEFQVAV